MSKRVVDNIVNISNKKHKTGHWSQGLLHAVEDPQLFIKSDDLVNVIKDKYPKSKFHYLILCKKNVANLTVLTKNDVDLLNYMDKIAKQLVKEPKHETSNFRIGYHAEASMFRLHLHVISDDMNSPFLKTKKHWNSFNSGFFIPSSEVIKSLSENSKIILPSRDQCKKYLELPLQCHKCSYVPKNMPDLKKHILNHLN